MRRWARYGVVLLLLAGLSGCGGSSTQDDKPKTMPINRFPNPKELQKHLDKAKKPIPNRNP